MKTSIIASLALASFLTVASFAQAGVSGKAVQEAAEFLTKKFGGQLAAEGAEKLAGRIASAAARHGDDVVAAVRKVGPGALRLADEAGDRAPQVMRLLSRYGDDAAVALSRPKAMALFVRHGDDAAVVLTRHQGIAEPLIQSMGRPALQALGAVGARNGRRLAMLSEGGDLAALGRSRDILSVIGKFGDPAMEFIWRHKGTLAVGTALTAFLADPKPFIDGTVELTDTLAANAVKPVVVAAGGIAQETARFLRWPLTILVGVLAVGLGFVLKNSAFAKAIVNAAARAVGARFVQDSSQPR